MFFYALKQDKIIEKMEKTENKGHEKETLTELKTLKAELERRVEDIDAEASGIVLFGIKSAKLDSEEIQKLNDLRKEYQQTIYRLNQCRHAIETLEAIEG